MKVFAFYSKDRARRYFIDRAAQRFFPLIPIRIFRQLLYLTLEVITLRHLLEIEKLMLIMRTFKTNQIQASWNKEKVL